MIWLSVVALGNMGVTIWLVRENRRLAQMAIARHFGEYNSMVRAEIKPSVSKKEKDESSYHTWRNPSEGVSP